MFARQSRPRLAMPWASSHAGSVRTRSSSALVCGFSRKPTTRPESSRRMIPIAEAASLSTGTPEMVTSAPLRLCDSIISWKFMR